ncbi:MAG: GntR family transcriptional regulator [Desulfatibacillum sp.]|nr:GntR family transcriptional regulator [Desulfatibacillum sp.]
MKLKEPKYKILETELKKNIMAGKWKPGAMIPTESELCKSTGTSRVTVRRALSNLEAEGLITRSPGRGTLVTDFRDGRNVWNVKGLIGHYIFTEDFNTELLGVDSVIPSPADYIFKGFDDAESITRFRLLRKLKDTPVSLVNTYISSEYTEKVLSLFDPEHNSFIFQIIEQITGKLIHRVEDILDIEPAAGDVAKWLKVPEGTPLFHLTSILTDEDDQLVQLTRLYLRPDIQKLSVVFEKNMVSRG